MDHFSTLLPIAAARQALLAALLAAPLACSAPGQAPSPEAVIAEVRAFEEKFNEAYESNDLEAYWSFYAPEMTQFYPQGRLDLADYQKYWNQHVGEGNRLIEVRMEDTGFHVGPSGDAAAVHYRVFVRTRHPDGSEAQEWAQETDVLLRRGGEWKVAHMHYSYPREGARSGTPSGTSGAAGAPGASREEAVAQVRDFIESFVRAYGTNDMGAYWGFFDPGMTMFEPEGRLDLPEFRAAWERSLASGARILEARLEDPVVHLGPSNDAAAVHYRLFTRTLQSDGSKLDEWSQESDVLMKRDGKWRIVHIHWSPAPARGAPAAS
jgi:ketosteroid isomerase-like protein